MEEMRRRMATLGTQRLPPSICPHCGGTLDAVTGAEIDSFIAPRLQRGDYTLCGYCLRLLRFDGRLHRAVPEAETREVLEQRPLLRSVRDGLLTQRAAAITSVSGKRKETVN